MDVELPRVLSRRREAGCDDHVACRQDADALAVSDRDTAVGRPAAVGVVRSHADRLDRDAPARRDLLMIPFLDISHHQGVVDFDALVAAAPEIPGVIIRAGNGLSKDRQVDRNMAEAKRVGLARSAYWFANPK